MSLRSTALLLVFLLTAASEVHCDSPDELLGESTSLREHLALGGFGLLTLHGCCVEVLPEGTWSLEATWVLSDTFTRTPVVSRHLQKRQEAQRFSLEELRVIQDAKPGLFVADGEFFGLELTFRRGLRPGLEMSVTLPLVHLSGGRTDAVGQWVDELLGIGLNGHAQLPSDSFALYLRRATGEEIYLFEAPGQGLGDLRLAGQGRLPIGSSRWTTTLGVVAELPTGDARRLHGSGSADLGVQLAWAKETGRRRLLGHVGAARLGAHTFLQTRATTALSGSLGYQLPLGRRWATTLRWYAAESVIQERSLADLSRPASFLEVGFVRRGAGGKSWHIAFSDNLPFQEAPLNNSFSNSDFTLQFGVRRVMNPSMGWRSDSGLAASLPKGPDSVPRSND